MRIFLIPRLSITFFDPKMLFPFFNEKSPNLGMKKLQKIIGDLLDEPGKLYMNRMVISKFLAALK